MVGLSGIGVSVGFGKVRVGADDPLVDVIVDEGAAVGGGTKRRLIHLGMPEYDS